MAIAAALAAGLITACNGGRGEAPAMTSPTATASPTAAASPTVTPSSEQQLLEQMVLHAEDLFTALTQAAAEVSTNEDVAAQEEDPEQELARLERWGRLLGYDVTFLPGPDTRPGLPLKGVNSTASLYRTAEGASDSFADDSQKALHADWVAAYPNLTNVEVRQIERPELADQVIWIRIAGLQVQAGSSLYIEDFVVLRRDRVRAFLRATSFFPASTDPDSLLEEIADLAARQVERIDAALPES